MSNYKKSKWAIQQIVRESGLVEDVCEHGVGHPNIEWLLKYDVSNDLGFWIHGCDGCCSKEMKEAIKKVKNE